MEKELMEAILGTYCKILEEIGCIKEQINSIKADKKKEIFDYSKHTTEIIDSYDLETIEKLNNNNNLLEINKNKDKDKIEKDNEILNKKNEENCIEKDRKNNKKIKEIYKNEENDIKKELVNNLNNNVNNNVKVVNNLNKNDTNNLKLDKSLKIKLQINKENIENKKSIKSIESIKCIPTLEIPASQYKLNSKFKNSLQIKKIYASQPIETNKKIKKINTQVSSTQTKKREFLTESNIKARAFQIKEIAFIPKFYKKSDFFQAIENELGNIYS